MDDTFTHEGLTFSIQIERDSHCDAPWEEEDGHGPVSDWTRRAKLPGEMVLSESRGMKRYFDFAETVRIAKREAWGHMPHKITIEADDHDRPAYTACGGWAIAGPYRAYDPENFNKAIAAVYAQHRASMTSRQYSAAAAMADFKRLKAWCDDHWHYVGVIVACTDLPGEPFESLWGFESDAGDDLQEVARELADEIISQEAAAVSRAVA
jgi:hypothetical protein